MNQIKPVPFTPKPAQIKGPTVVLESTPLRRGELDTTVVAQRIDPKWYAEKLQKAKERAKNHR